MPKISVIVPIYNVEKFLSECIESILSQTFTDFELILVDDGSLDNCGKICDEYAKKDTRIIVIHQDNKGLSGARNTGIDIAQGQYIAFIDSDDVVTCDYLKNLLYAIEENDADISICRMKEFEENSDISKEILYKKEIEYYHVYNNKEACVKLYEGDKNLPVSACAKLYKKELFCEIRFPVGRIHEDDATTPKLYYKSKKIISIENEMYYYRERFGSIMRRKFSVKRYDGLLAKNSCIEFFKDNEEYEIVKVAELEKKRLLAVYTIFAKRDKVVVPKEYRMTLWSALVYLRKTLPSNKFEYYVAMLNPKLVIVNEYIVKMEKILRIRK